MLCPCPRTNGLKFDETVMTSNWTEREFTQVHGRIVSRLKAAVHVHISAPETRGRISDDPAMSYTNLSMATQVFASFPCLLLDARRTCTRFRRCSDTPRSHTR